MKYISNGYSLQINEGSLYYKDNDKFIKYNAGRFSQIEKTEYLYNSYGKYYIEIQKHFKENLENCTVRCNQNEKNLAVCSTKENTINLFDFFGNKIFGISGYDIFPAEAYSAVSFNKKLYIAYPTLSIVAIYSLCDKCCKCFIQNKFVSFPEDLFLFNDNILVSNMGKCNLLQINSKNKIKEKLEFSEPIWEYVRDGEHEYVRLDSGIYLL